MLYLFDQDDKFICILTEETGLVDSWFKDYQNHIVDESFIFKVKSSSPLLKYIESENQVAFYDRDGKLRLMRMKQLYEETSQEESVIRVVCEPSYLELYDHFIEDRRITNGTAQTALNRVLEGSRYVGEVAVELGLSSDNFYWIDGVDAVFRILENWGGALKDTITLNADNEIIERKIWIVQRLGADNGLIVEPDFNAEQIERKTLSYVETALWGQGSSLEITDDEEEHTGGYTRYITFEDVVWSKSNGDPVDKPKGQKWVGDPQALNEYGYLHNGIRKHRYGHFSNQDYETPEELLMATWLELQERKLKEIIHEATINPGDKKVSLGDTVTILNRKYNKPIELQSQITGLEYDVFDDEEVTIIIGKYIDMNEDPLQKDVDDLKDVVHKPRPTAPITDESFPDIVPGIPVSIDAVGGIGVIQLYWDYDSKVYISHYEVYGSQVADFVPDSQHLLYRGRVSAFAHIVDTDEKWYYYLRAVNTRDTPSGFSVRVEASSVRVITDDILFGSIIADHLSNNLDIADKLAQNTIDSINEGPMQAIEYTKQEIIDTENRLLGQLNNQIGDVNTSISDLLSRTQGIEGTVTNVVQDVNIIDGKLSTTITQLGNIDGVVSDHSTTLQQHAGLINAKAEKTEVYTQTETNGLLGDKVDFSIYSNKMTNLDFTIDGLNTTVSNTSATVNELSGEIVNAQSQIANLDIRAGGIELGVSNLQNDLVSTQRDVAAISIKADGIISTVENIQIGGRNLILNSNESIWKVGSGYQGSTVTVAKMDMLDEWGFSEAYRVRTTGGTHAYKSIFVTTNKVSEPLVLGQDYTFSVYVKNLGAKDAAVSFNGLSNQDLYTIKPGETIRVVKSGRRRIDYDWFQVFLRTPGTSGDSLDVVTGRAKLEKGNVATDWSPAPEDADARMTKSESKITQLSDEVDIKVDKNGVVASINLSPEGVRINGNRHHITGQTLIDDAVIGTGAIANLSVTNAKMALLSVGTAQIQNAAITNAKIANLNADKINAGAIRGIDIYGARFRSTSGTDWMEIVGGNVHLNQANGRYVNINPDGLFGYNANGSLRFKADASLVMSAALGTANSNVYLAPVDWGEARVVSYDSIPGGGAATDYTYRPIRAQSFIAPPLANAYIGTDGELRVTNAGTDGIYRDVRANGIYANFLDARGTAENIYIRPRTAGGELRVTTTGSTVAYRDVRARRFAGTQIGLSTSFEGVVNFYVTAAGNGETRFVARADTSAYIPIRAGRIFSQSGTFESSGTNLTLYHPNSSGRIFLQTHLDVRATKPGNASSFVNVVGASFVNNSVVESKQDIFVWEDNALDIVNSGTIYGYRLKTEVIDGIDQIRYGMVIGAGYRTPAEIINGDGVDQYVMASVNWRATQELDTKVIKIEDRLDEKDLQIQFLTQKIRELEENAA